MKKLTIIALACLRSLAVAQASPEAPSVHLTDTEALTLKIGLLEQELAEANAKIAGLKQQLTLYSTYQSHGWKSGEVSIKLNRDGLPEAVLIPVTVTQHPTITSKPNTIANVKP